MTKNKIVLFISFILACALLMNVSVAYGDTALTISKPEQNVQTNIVKLAKEDGYKDLLEWEYKLVKNKQKYVKKINKYLETWKPYLSKSQKKNLKKYQKQIIKSFSIQSASNIYSEAKNIIKQAKQVKKNREKAINEIDSCRKMFKSYLSKDDLAKIKTYKKKINSTCSLIKIEKYKNKTLKLIYASSYLTDYIDITGWSLDKIHFVEKWGDNNWYYLNNKVALGQRSPMRDYSYHIAAAAYDYGIDPRLCAAISWSESGCGVQNCAPYNAWGWITNALAMYSWPDAIDKWSSFFKNYFGSSLTYSGAVQYSGGMSNWYSFIMSEAGKIGNY